ncbi:MAG: extracellular solute-binding protein, partial [Eubacteriales bacterium]|nr:extracellular solute-binding protein [Eubacteriales bacterium]
PFDLGGRQVKMISWQVADLNGDSPTAGSYAVAVYNNTKLAELKYNFTMVYDKSYCMTAGTYHEKIMAEIMAGINPADIFTINNSDVRVLSFIKNKMVVCVDDYIDFEEDIYMKNHTWLPTTEYKGKIYGMTHLLYTGNNGIIYNTAILAKEGLRDIWDLYEENRWNWQTLLDYSVKATRDTNGDGIIDQWGSTVYSNSQFVIFLLNSNGLPAVGQVDGNMICNYDTPAGKRALQFAVDLTFVHKVVGNGGGNEFRKGNVLFLWGPFWYNESCIKANLTTSLVGPLPAGPDRPETVSIKAPGTNFYVSALSSIPKEASLILRDILITWTEDGLKPNEALIAAEKNVIKPWEEGSLKRYYWTERDAVNSSQCVYPVIAEFSTMTGADKIAANIVNDIMKGVSVSTAVETYIGQINAVLEEINR